MRIRFTRKRTLGAAVGAAVVFGAAVAVTLPTAAAAADDIGVDILDSNRYQSWATNTSDGQAFIQSDFWNPAASGRFTMYRNPDYSYFTVSGWNAPVYFQPGREPGCVLNTDVFDPTCQWAGHGDPWVPQASTTGIEDQFGTRGDNPYVSPATNPYKPPAGENWHEYYNDPQFGMQIHAPAAYPSIVVGCHWGNCSGDNGKPFPIQASALTSLQSTWEIDESLPYGETPTDAWDAAYDIWFDRNLQGLLPASPAELNNPGQNDGTEIMIWVSNSGYKPYPIGKPVSQYDSAVDDGKIRPAGRLLATNVTIPGVQTTTVASSGQGRVTAPVTFDVWGGRARSFDNAVRWNVVSFVARTPGLALTTTQVPAGTPLPQHGPPGPYPGTPDTTFEANNFIRYAANDLNSAGLTCDTSDPVTAVTVSPGNPDPAAHEKTRCLDPSWWLTSVQAGFEIWDLAGAATLWSDRFAVYPSTMALLSNSRSVTSAQAASLGVPAGTPIVTADDTFQVSTAACPGGTAKWSIDAANLGGTTHKAIGSDLGFVPASNGSGVVPVTVKSLPLLETAASSGSFATRDVNNPAAKVSLSNIAAGLHLQGKATLSTAVTCGDGRTISNQSTLYIEAPATTGNVDVTLHQTTQWVSNSGGGYCADIVATNHGSSTVTWTADVTLPGAIYNAWNFTKVPLGDGRYRITGVDWNKTLAPGASTNSVGYCANN